MTIGERGNIDILRFVLRAALRRAFGCRFDSSFTRCPGALGTIDEHYRPRSDPPRRQQVVVRIREPGGPGFIDKSSSAIRKMLARVIE